MALLRATTRTDSHAADKANADMILIERIRAGDSLAFELVMRRHNRRLYRIARSIVRNNAEAEDIVQETYVRAYQKLDSFTGPNGFTSWLCRIAFNEALGRLRKRGRVISLDDYVTAPEGGADGAVRRIDTMKTEQPDPEQLTANAELRRILEAAIDTLPDDFRSVFVLRAVEGMSVAETADALGLRPETVKTRLHRARLKLRRILEARYSAVEPAAFDIAGARCDRIVAGTLARVAALRA